MKLLKQKNQKPTFYFNPPTKTKSYKNLHFYVNKPKKFSFSI